MCIVLRTRLIEHASSFRRSKDQSENILERQREILCQDASFLFSLIFNFVREVYLEKSLIKNGASQSC